MIRFPNFVVWGRNVAAISLLVYSGYASSDQYSSLVGYWQVYNRHGERHGVVYINIEDGMLEGYGVRSFPTRAGKIDYLCERCPGKYHNKPLWSGKYHALTGFKKNKNGNEWYGGVALSPKRGMVFYPSIELDANGNGSINVPVWFFTIKAKLKKISKKQAFQECQQIRTLSDMQRWGDLDESRNRDAMLSSLGVDEHAFMRSMNAGDICLDPAS